MDNPKFQPECFHCGLPVPDNIELTASIMGINQPMCCYGCKAVAEAIGAAGLDDFYRYRTVKSATAAGLVPDFLHQPKAYDNPAIQKTFITAGDNNLREASLILEGINCAACAWLNEQHLSALPGVIDVNVNYATHRATIKWDNGRIQLSDILIAISQIGYIAHPYDPGRYQQIVNSERRQHLRRLGVAGVLGMQVMVLAVALYHGQWTGMEKQYEHFFYWLSLTLTSPILLFSARPFFTGAWRDIKNLRTGMDVPVTLGISLAFGASVWTTLHGQGHVYFDSVAMFVFFLLAARYFELVARKKSTEASEALFRLRPTSATRIRNNSDETVAAVELCSGDTIRVRPGEIIPADGVILEGESGVDESLLTGESLPINKSAGHSVIGGSLNNESPLIVQVTQVGNDTVIAQLIKLVERSQAQKPALDILANRVAGWFVAIILVLAAGVAIFWWQTAPDRWLPVTIAVLVVTCPCALSLATPTALTSATANLAKSGLLITAGNALETLARATHVVFDKTGTLTNGNLSVTDIKILSDVDATSCYQLASVLESGSEHPIARAFIRENNDMTVTALLNTAGGGLEGDIAGTTYFIGTTRYITDKTGIRPDQKTLGDLSARGQTLVILAERSRLLAVFTLTDSLRPGATELVSQLKQQGIAVSLLTGDNKQAAKQVADQCGVDDFHAQMTPDDKLAAITQLQRQGQTVVMIGDGVNDAPVLAAAHVSIAIGSGAYLAAASADMILLSSQLEHIGNGFVTARRTLGVIKQNLFWALVYNLLALPLAATGLVAPWMAAVGMSFSSLVVVGNSLRLLRQ